MTRKHLPVLAAIVVLSGALAFAMLTTDHDWGDDFAAYIMQAASIVHGTVRASAARSASAVNESSRFFGPVAAPWGFPIALAPVYAACGGLNIFCLKLVNLPFFALFLLAMFPFLARRLSPFDAALVLAILAFSPVFLAFHDYVLSDIAFLFFSTWSIVLIEAFIVVPLTPEGRPLRNVALGLVLFAAFLVRTNGIVLLPTLLLTQVVVHRRQGAERRPFRQIVATALIPYLVFGVLAVVLVAVAPGGEAGTLGHFTTLTFARLSDNFSAYVILPSIFFWPVPFYEISYGALLPFVAAGIVLHHEEDFHALLYVGLTLLLFIAWPEQQGLRYIFPVLPFMIYWAYRGMRTTAFALAERHRRAGELLTRAVWIAMLAFFVAASVRLARTNLAAGRVRAAGPFAPVSAEMFDAIKATPPDSVIIFDKPRAMTLMTDRKTLLIDRCDQLGRGNFVVIRKQVAAADQVPADRVTTCNPSLAITPAFENRVYVVYRIQPKR